MRKIIFSATMMAVFIFAIFFLLNRPVKPIYLENIIVDRIIELDDINEIVILDMNDLMVESQEDWLKAIGSVLLITPLKESSPKKAASGDFYQVKMEIDKSVILLKIYDGYLEYNEVVYTSDEIAYEAIIDMIESQNEHK